MANISYRNKKFPIKAIPTVGISFLIALTISSVAWFILKDDVEFKDLNAYQINEIDYEFQQILEQGGLDKLEIQLRNEICQYYAQSGSFRSKAAASSQVSQLSSLGYESFVENVNSRNGYNFKVIVGPFETKSATNNAQEILRQQRMDSIEIKSCRSINRD